LEADSNETNDEELENADSHAAAAAADNDDDDSTDDSGDDEDGIDMSGLKCRAPFTHSWGQMSFHNAVILSVLPDQSQVSSRCWCG